MQTCLRFCRGGVSKAQAKDTNKSRAMPNLFGHCRDEVSKTKSKIRISRAPCQIYLGPICDFEFGPRPAERTQVRRRTAGLRRAEAAVRCGFRESVNSLFRINWIFQTCVVYMAVRAAACEGCARADASSGPSPGGGCGPPILWDRFCIARTSQLPILGENACRQNRRTASGNPRPPGGRGPQLFSVARVLCRLRPEIHF